MAICLMTWTAEAFAAPNAGERDTADRDTAETAEVELERPMRIVVNLEADDDGDERQLRGRLVRYGEVGFEVVDRHEQTHRLAWEDLPPERVYAMHRELLPRDDGRGWLELGIRLRRMDGGERLSDRALRLAARADAELADLARAVREHGPDALEADDADRASGPPSGPPSERRQQRESESRPESDAPAHDNDAGDDAPATITEGPASAGEVRREHWGEVDEQEHQWAIDRLGEFAETGLERIDVAMQRHETDYFLIYTDMRPTEARRWGQLADRMYHRLAELFDVEPERNIWRGKALVLMFNEQADYRRFEAEVHGLPGADTAGRCWTFGSGEVHITLFRQPDRYRFAYVLVHEATHGFVHRYRSPERIPAWLNEGLADTIAAELVPEDGSVQRRQRQAIRKLQEEQDLGNLFEAYHLEPWHYGLASSMTQYMIRENRAGYVAMIDAIKDGTPWRQALEEHYGQSLAQFVRQWGESENIRNLTP